jgi:membrane-bound serine protease (ClpP class)
VQDSLRTYIVAQLPGWLLAAVAISALAHWVPLPTWVGVGVVTAWVIKDLLLYPAMRHYYRPALPDRRIVGQLGIAVTDLAPRGFVRIHGELWQAESEEEIREGAGILVRDVSGLRLRVAASGTDHDSAPA